jgi:D-sedoheptulose 7-phosphate isomerase
LDSIDLPAILRIVERLRVARDAGRTIFIAGNGGSAATASHWVNDLGKATKRSGRRPLRVMGLTDNVSWLTALANDEGYERAFSGQLENFVEPGDVLAVISASGNSPNVLNAVEAARAASAVTVGFVGFDGGKLRGLVDECLWVPTPQGAYGVVESAHTVACDIVTTCLIGDSPTEPTSAVR